MLWQNSGVGILKVDYVSHMGSDLSVVNAARVSFDQESTWEEREVTGYDMHGKYWDRVKELSQRDRKLVDYLAKHKHTSCFEHQAATLRLKVPIFIARQIQRHRTFSYNEVSRRYVDSTPEFFWPDKWRAKADNVKQGSSDEEVPVNTEFLLRDQALHDHMISVHDLYNGLLGSGVAPELARMILPQNMYTEFYMTGNLRNWAHFLKLRLDGHAQKEVQDVAQQVHNILAPLFPVSVEALMKYD